jgi:hypothetical protein
MLLTIVAVDAMTLASWTAKVRVPRCWTVVFTPITSA